MSGNDGGSKLNILNAPSVKTCEAESSASSFAVEKTRQKSVEKPKTNVVAVAESSAHEDIKTEPKTEQETPNKTEETIEIQSEFLSLPIKDEAPKKKGKKIDIKGEFLKVKDIVFKMYDKVFNSTSSFKPTYKETIADLLLYLSKKLSIKNANESFDLEFGLTGVNVPDKYCSGYIPLCLKLSKWCKDKGVLDVCEDLLFAITSLYLNSANLNGLTVTELELTNDFENEIEYAL